MPFPAALLSLSELLRAFSGEGLPCLALPCKSRGPPAAGASPRRCTEAASGGGGGGEPRGRRRGGPPGCSSPRIAERSKLPLFLEEQSSQHAGHPPSRVEMIWCHGIPDASVVSFVLLLFFTASELGKGCNITEGMISVSPLKKIHALEQYLLRDYPVQMPSNLKQNESCLRLWELYFIRKMLIHMYNMSGEKMKDLIQNLKAHTDILESCEFEDKCVSFEQKNVSQFLKSIPNSFEEMDQQIGNPTRKIPRNVATCIKVQCEPDSGVTPSIQRFEQTPLTISSSAYRTAPLGRYHWLPLLVLILLVGLLIAVRFSFGKPLQRRRRIKESEI